MLKIGEFSKLSRTSIRLLRIYDEAGLLAPETIDPFTGYRYYKECQLPAATPPSGISWDAGRTGRPWSGPSCCKKPSFRRRRRKRSGGCGFWIQPLCG